MNKNKGNKYWSELPCPSPGDPADPRIEPPSSASPALQADSLLCEPPGKLTPFKMFTVFVREILAAITSIPPNFSDFSQFSHSVASNSLRPHGLQHARLPCPSPTPRTYSNSCPSSRWCRPAASSSVALLLPAFCHSQHQGLFHWVSSSHQVAKVLEFQLQHPSFQ